MHCAFCRQALGYVHGHAACLRNSCPMFGVNQAECCAGDRGDCIPTSSVAVAPSQPLEPALKPACEQTRR